MARLPGAKTDVFFGWSKNLPDWRASGPPKPLSAEVCKQLTGIEVGGEEKAAEDTPTHTDGDSEAFTLVRYAKRLHMPQDLQATLELAAALPKDLPAHVAEETWRDAANMAAGYGMEEGPKQEAFQKLGRFALRYSKRFRSTR